MKSGERVGNRRTSGRRIWAIRIEEHEGETCRAQLTFTRGNQTWIWQEWNLPVSMEGVTEADIVGELYSIALDLVTRAAAAAQ